MPEITRTLLIRHDPLAQILSGEKTWEVRSRPTKVVGELIGLSESRANLIKATCVIRRVVGPLSMSQLRRNARRMGFTQAEIREELWYWKDETRRGRVYAWVLSNVRRLRTPVRFRNPSGAVTFVNVPARVASRIPSVRSGLHR